MVVVPFGLMNVPPTFQLSIPRSYADFICDKFVLTIPLCILFQSRLRKLMQEKKTAENDQNQLKERISEIKQT